MPIRETKECLVVRVFMQYKNNECCFFIYKLDYVYTVKFQQINSTSFTVQLDGMEDASLYTMFVTAHNIQGSSLPSSILIINCTKES